ncbi:hypothetical protein ES702_04419 [subsurface metagenome]
MIYVCPMKEKATIQQASKKTAPNKNNISPLPTKEIIQTYRLTLARGKFTVHERRIYYKILEAVQSMYLGQKLKGTLKIKSDLFNDQVIAFNVNEILLPGENQHHSRIKEALTSLLKKYITYEDETQWLGINLLQWARYNKGGEIEIVLTKMFREALVKFTGGYRKFYVHVAMKLTSPYPMRFYELFSNQAGVMEYKISDLKKMFGLEKKYSDPKDFIRRVVKYSKEQLDEHAIYSFDYKALPPRGTKKSIRFYPYVVKENIYKLQDEMELLDSALSPLTLKTLTKIEFTTAEITKNILLFINAEFHLSDVVAHIVTIHDRGEAKQIKNKKGYIINGLKKELQKTGIERFKDLHDFKPTGATN